LPETDLVLTALLLLYLDEGIYEDACVIGAEGWFEIDLRLC